MPQGLGGIIFISEALLSEHIFLYDSCNAQGSLLYLLWTDEADLEGLTQYFEPVI